jgi:TPR repeat protein
MRGEGKWRNGEVKSDLVEAGSCLYDDETKLHMAIKRRVQRKGGSWDDLAASELQQLKDVGNKGHAMTQLNLGLMYYKGQGADRSFVEAVRWWRKGAEQDSSARDAIVACCFNLGQSYMLGKGVARCDKQAIQWLRKAADNGFVKAMYNMGIMYFQGQCVIPSCVEAL